MSQEFTTTFVVTEAQEGQDVFTEKDKPRWNPFADAKTPSVNRIFRSQFAFMPLSEESDAPDLQESKTAPLREYFKRPLHA